MTVRHERANLSAHLLPGLSTLARNQNLKPGLSQAFASLNVNAPSYGNPQVVSARSLFSMFDRRSPLSEHV